MPLRNLGWLVRDLMVPVFHVPGYIISDLVAIEVACNFKCEIYACADSS